MQTYRPRSLRGQTSPPRRLEMLLPRAASKSTNFMSTPRETAEPSFFSAPAVLIGIALLLGTVYALYLFPPDFLAGTSPFWQSPPTDDIKVQLSGARYFTMDQWHFPLLRTTKINPPDGISIIYTDALPLFAVAAKCLVTIFNIRWLYFGSWVGICYLLQPASMALLLISLGIRSPIANFAAIVIASSAPIFLFRLFHTNLCAHFLVISALTLYFVSVRSASFHRSWPWFCFLSWIALWVHAYLFVMISMIFFATAAQVACADRGDWRQVGWAIGVWISGALLIMWISGYFWERAGLNIWHLRRAKQFGFWSMNLLSPVIPQWSGLFPGLGAWIGVTQGPWPEVIDATGGQYEGYQYLGAGVLFLLVVALWCDGKDVARRAKKYWGILIAFVILTSLAVTHHAFIGRWEIPLLNKMPVPDLLDEIRSSGRLFWPVGYGVMAYAIAVVAVRTSGYMRLGLLLIATVVQVVDVGPIRNWVHQWVRHGYEDEGRFPPRPWSGNVLPPTPWVDLIRYHKQLEIYPTFECLHHNARIFQDIVDLVFYASESVTPVNTMWTDRDKAKECPAELISVDRLGISKAELLVILDAQYAERFLSSEPEYRQLCRSFDKGIVCSHRWGDMDEKGLGAAFKPL
jgi:hypothetical protein